MNGRTPFCVSKYLYTLAYLCRATAAKAGAGEELMREHELLQNLVQEQDLEQDSELGQKQQWDLRQKQVQ